MTDFQNTINKAAPLSSKARTYRHHFCVIAIGGSWLISNSVQNAGFQRKSWLFNDPNGTLLAAVDPGWYTQWFGSVTKYPLRSQYFIFIGTESG